MDHIYASVTRVIPVMDKRIGMTAQLLENYFRVQNVLYTKISSYLSDCFMNKDIDECTENKDNCDVNATCMNSDGSFSCTCDTGYTGNGASCSGMFYAHVSAWYM